MHLDQQYYVYLLASKLGGTLYVGVTNNLVERVSAHRDGIGSKFTAKYCINRLVYFEVHEEIDWAIKCEKQVKRWRRAWKIRMIEEKNPNWDDLFPSLV
ncbi:GIY-YIG nuclease family protein [Labrenzia sp. VG12]|uniref:GIY-YIG nuclease family protein n=1 Tax=Labrenzia sp. VG12 TaxID=2021862 RepID=UPI000B8BFF91|nr:GIY-YIG nuclease family protein [Labrenzia sp. VG12]ASP33617.1 excinuclease ABC subunit C [Labrenzia sp. VG12]